MCLFSQIARESVGNDTAYLVFQHRVVFSSFVQNEGKFDILGEDSISSCHCRKFECNLWLLLLCLPNIALFSTDLHKRVPLSVYVVP